MNIPVIDLHADTYMKKVLLSKYPYFKDLYIRNNQKGKNDKNEYKRVDKSFDITDKYLKKGGVKVQTQSLYISDIFLQTPLHISLNILQLIKNDIEKYNIFQVFNFKDIESNLNNNKTGILISIEGLEVIENDLDLLDVFYELGVRIVAPTWNRALPYFSSVEEPYGILSKGKDLIKKMQNLNLILDTSHMSEKSFFDASKFDIPLIATHSNAKNVNKHKRNLSDDQIKVLVEKGGVMGINFNPPFLKPDKYDEFLKRYNLSYDEKEGKVVDRNKKYPEGFYWIYNLIDYIGNKFNLDILAFGSDFDGIGTHPQGVENASFYQEFAEFLSEMGLATDEIEKIFYKNTLKVLKKILD